MKLNTPNGGICSLNGERTQSHRPGRCHNRVASAGPWRTGWPGARSRGAAGQSPRERLVPLHSGVVGPGLTRRLGRCVRRGRGPIPGPPRPAAGGMSGTSVAERGVPGAEEVDAAVAESAHQRGDVQRMRLTAAAGPPGNSPVDRLGRGQPLVRVGCRPCGRRRPGAGLRWRAGRHRGGVRLGVWFRSCVGCHPSAPRRTGWCSLWVAALVGRAWKPVPAAGGAPIRSATAGRCSARDSWR